ncbi:MAG: hypothetical protein Kow0074_08160 [Candidatus Zixiibacteriota bacterium]
MIDPPRVKTRCERRDDFEQHKDAKAEQKPQCALRQSDTGCRVPVRGRLGVRLMSVSMFGHVESSVRFGGNLLHFP